MKSVATKLLLPIFVALWGATLCAEEAPVADLSSLFKAAETYQSGQSLEPMRQIQQRVRESIGQPILQRQIESGLIELLGTNSTFEARKFACQELGIIGGSAALPALQELLQSEETAGIACLALTAYPPGRADEMLRKTLDFTTGKTRAQILNTIGDRADAKAIPVLIREAGNANLETAEAAIASLGKIASPAAAKAVRAISAKERRPQLQAVLSESLLRCADALFATGQRKAALELYNQLVASSNPLGVRRAALAALLRTDKDGGEKRVLEILSGSDDALKPVVLQRIPSLSSPDLSEKLSRRMHDLSLDQQVQIISCLAGRGDDAARLELAKAMSSPEPALRRAAIAGLAEMRDPYFLSLLANAAGSGDSDDAKAIENALVALKGGKETDTRLSAELKNALPKARVVLIGALSRRQGSAANTLLLDESDSYDPSVAKAALRALAKTGGEEQAGPLLKKVAAMPDAGVRTEAQSTASQLLRKIRQPEHRSELVKAALESAKNDENRCALLELLGTCGDAGALAMAKTALADPEIEIRLAALRALANWPDDKAWDLLLEEYRRTETPTTHSIALGGLVKVLGEQSQNAGRPLLMHYNELLRGARSTADQKLLLSSISDLAYPEALGLVTPFLSNAEVHAEAAAAAQRIVENVKKEHPELAEDAVKRLQQK